MDDKSSIETKLKQAGKKSPFRVPDDYFPDFNIQLKERIANEEVPGKAFRYKPLKLVSIAAAAAIFIGLVLYGYNLFFVPAVSGLTTDDIALALEEDIFGLDEFELALSSQSIDEAATGIDVLSYKDEVIQYLLDENIELESIVNEL